MQEVPVGPRGGSRSLKITTVVIFLTLPLTYRIPISVFTHIFPKEYVYRFDLAITEAGKVYEGATINGCRVTSTASPGWIPLDHGSNDQEARLTGTGLNIDISDGGFVALPPTAICAPTRFSPNWFDSRIKEVASEQTVFTRHVGGTPVAFVFDDKVAPAVKTVLRNASGARALGFEFSNIKLSAANWSQLTDQMSGRSSQPWVSPFFRSCLNETDWHCHGEPNTGYTAVKVSVSEAAVLKGFSEWAQGADKSKYDVPVSPSTIRKQFGHLRLISLRPDPKSGRWLPTTISPFDAEFYALGARWSGDLKNPVICFSSGRCVATSANSTIVDWDSGEIFALFPETSAATPLIYKGE